MNIFLPPLGSSINLNLASRKRKRDEEIKPSFNILNLMKSLPYSYKTLGYLKFCYKIEKMSSTLSVLTGKGMCFSQPLIFFYTFYLVRAHILSYLIFCSPSGQQFVSCKEVSSYLQSIFAHTEAQLPMNHRGENMQVDNRVSTENVSKYVLADLSIKIFYVNVKFMGWTAVCRCCP